MFRVLPILVSAVLLAGCGQKGPLYLPVIPAGPAPAAQPPAATAPALPQPPASAPPATGTASPIRHP